MDPIRGPYRDRRDAAAALAEALGGLRGRDDLLVLGLPRGGVPVAAGVARALGAPLDVLVVRKLGVPGQEELAFGAIASGGTLVLNESVVDTLGLGQEVVERVAEAERERLLARERLLRDDRPAPSVEGRCVVLVDDGLATGATMRAAVAAVRSGGPARIVVAVPVAPAETVERLAHLADEVVCPYQPPDFYAVGQWYLEFPPVSDEEVREVLAEAPQGGT